MVDDHLRVRQDEAARRRNRDATYRKQTRVTLFSFGQTVQIIDDGDFVSVTQEINNATVVDVTDHAAGLVEQMNLVNADRCADSTMVHGVGCLVYSWEHTAYRSLLIPTSSATLVKGRRSDS